MGAIVSRDGRKRNDGFSSMAMQCAAGNGAQPGHVLGCYRTMTCRGSLWVYYLAQRDAEKAPSEARKMPLDAVAWAHSCTNTRHTDHAEHDCRRQLCRHARQQF
jgi:hypothetical protein